MRNFVTRWNLRWIFSRISSNAPQANIFHFSRFRHWQDILGRNSKNLQIRRSTKSVILILLNKPNYITNDFDLLVIVVVDLLNKTCRSLKRDIWSIRRVPPSSNWVWAYVNTATPSWSSIGSCPGTISRPLPEISIRTGGAVAYFVQYICL